MVVVTLLELRSKDCFFTWTNNKDQESRISRKLDRCLVNLTWSEKYALLEFEALPPGLSDHSPLIVSMRKDMKIRNVPFRFLICGHHILNFLDSTKIMAFRSKWICNVQIME